MRWRKLGHVFAPSGQHAWMTSHAANTVAEHLDGDTFRVDFSSRAPDQRAHVASIDVDLVPPFTLRAVAKEPALAPGEIGAFDDSGVSLSCIRTVRGRKFLYYLGWNLGVTVPWRNSIGLAIQDPETGAWKRHSRAPLLDRHDVDPFSISYPFVLEDGPIYRMWYGSNLSWGKEQRDMAHIIKYAESDDALSWKRTGRIALPFKDETEYAMSRPFVRKRDGRYHMWYSYRGARYRIGYATSEDALEWRREDDRVGIDISPEGWDSEMVCYPFLYEHRGETYMLYNGNGYGRTGFGLAVLESWS